MWSIPSLQQKQKPSYVDLVNLVPDSSEYLQAFADIKVGSIARVSLLIGLVDFVATANKP